MAQKALVMYQKIIGLVAKDNSIGKNRGVGTFTMGLREKPDNNTITTIDEELKKIAGWEVPRASILLDYIEAKFILGGPLKS